MSALKNNFFSLCFKYTDSNSTVEKCWKEVEDHYTAPGRHYHTLAHLEFMLNEFIPIRTLFADADAALFALYYHDIIYDPAKGDNEEKSAALGKERLQQLQVPEEKASACLQHILATKDHELSENNDTNLFTDLDLAVLGAEEGIYDAYSKAVRREYSMYPDFLYKPGRKKVLKHLLAMKGMFKTPVFAKKLEKQARENMEREINAL
jgi:predicted metal-dependent HD superfamily phosphohydrolase